MNVLTPFAVQVGAVVTVPLSHLWPVAGMDSVLVSAQPVTVHLYTVEPSFSQVAGVVVPASQTWSWAETGIVIVPLPPEKAISSRS